MYGLWYKERQEKGYREVPTLWWDWYPRHTKFLCWQMSIWSLRTTRFKHLYEMQDMFVWRITWIVHRPYVHLNLSQTKRAKMVEMCGWTFDWSKGGGCFVDYFWGHSEIVRSGPSVVRTTERKMFHAWSGYVPKFMCFGRTVLLEVVSVHWHSWVVCKYFSQVHRKVVELGGHGNWVYVHSSSLCYEEAYGQVRGKCLHIELGEGRRTCSDSKFFLT